MTELEQLALTLHDIEAVKFGRFQLASGQISPIYIDLRMLIARPSALRAAADAYVRILRNLEFDLLGAIPYGGLPIGTAVALAMDVPMIFPRKAVKSYGTGKTIEGKFRVGQRVAIIEDLVTSGESALGGVAMIKAAGLQVRDIVVLLDRQQGGARNILERGYTLHSVMTMGQLLATLEEDGRISLRQRNEVLAALQD